MATGRISLAPADVFDTVELSRAARLRVVSAPVAPMASAERIMAPNYGIRHLVNGDQ